MAASPPPVTVLDGGMGKHLERSGAPFRQPEWSALALLEAPETVKAAHIDYLDAGADVITANSYAVAPFHLGDVRFDDRGAELAALAGSLAREAVGEHGGEALVAGSIPPMFGSYEPERFDPERAPELLDILIVAQAPYVDLWIAETVSSIAEAVAILDALDRCRALNPRVAESVWMSFTVPDDRPGDTVDLRSGEPIPDAVAAVVDRVDAVLLNCSPPEAITVAIGHVANALAGTDRVRFGAYANAFEPKSDGYAANEVSLGRRNDLTPEEYRAVTEGWIARGATIVGGCCQMFPEHIHALANTHS